MLTGLAGRTGGGTWWLLSAQKGSGLLAGVCELLQCQPWANSREGDLTDQQTGAMRCGQGSARPTHRFLPSLSQELNSS